MNRVLVVDKPAGMTSHDVVARVRRIAGERSIGHLGTLDPMATGVLPLVLGSWTRLAQFYTGSDKTYEGTIRFGYATTTYDAEGDAVGAVAGVDALTLETVRRASEQFAGEIDQVPPPFSAKKIGGVPAYKLARKDKPVELKAARVRIDEFTIESLEGDTATFRARVSGGTYIRSLAHELGAALGTGAHLASLRRTRSGEFGLEDAVTLKGLEKLRDAGTTLESVWFHPRRLMPEMPSVSAAPDAAAAIRNGRSVNLPEFSKAKLVKVFAGQVELIAIAARVAGTLFQPKVVFPAE